MLTDAKCRNATCPPEKKRARFTDAAGMYLEVSPAGSKRWFLKYSVAGVEKRLALGSYPKVQSQSDAVAQIIALTSCPVLLQFSF